MPCQVLSGTKLAAAYEEPIIYERHRHRYVFANQYREQYEAGGVIFSGIQPEQNVVEVMELEKHPWFLGVQYHPEFKSRPEAPHPLFLAFVRAALQTKKKQEI